MTARKNEIVGIVGESGCGKSTLLKLLLRFWERSGGQIRYNGTDIDEINTESLYRNVTMVSQSTYLFDATIAENLRVAKPDATDEELMAALRMASAEELVQALPEGLNTPAGLLGGRLSMGERQRIGLARAFLSGCPLILLDEPTSNVDSINEGVILRALLKHKQDQDDYPCIPPRIHHGGGGPGIQNGKRTNGGASNMNRGYFQKFQIKDVVFLAIMSAVALATCAVMPLVISLQPLIFGISQLVTALQIGVFFAIGLYKVRKPGSLLIMALMMGLIQLMMSPPMFLSSVLNGILIELIVLLLFRGYEKDAAVFVAAMLHTPLSLPFNYFYNRLVKGADSPLGGGSGPSAACRRGDDAGRRRRVRTGSADRHQDRKGAEKIGSAEEMSEKLYVKHPLFPMAGIAVSVFTFAFGLAMAKSPSVFFFLGGMWLLLALFGYLRPCLAVLPAASLLCGIFCALTYAISRDTAQTSAAAARCWRCASRPYRGWACAVCLVRGFSCMRLPRVLTLAMLITFTFFPLLRAEVRQTREAMRTRGAGGLLNPTILYRAFLIPLMVRLVNLSDTLALSVETRGFSTEAAPYTVYRPVYLQVKDGAFAALSALCAMGAVLL